MLSVCSVSPSTLKTAWSGHNWTLVSQHVVAIISTLVLPPWALLNSSDKIPACLYAATSPSIVEDRVSKTLRNLITFNAGKSGQAGPKDSNIWSGLRPTAAPAPPLCKGSQMETFPTNYIWLAVPVIFQSSHRVLSHRECNSFSPPFLSYQVWEPSGVSPHCQAGGFPPAPRLLIYFKGQQGVGSTAETSFLQFICLAAWLLRSVFPVRGTGSPLKDLISYKDLILYKMLQKRKQEYVVLWVDHHHLLDDVGFSLHVCLAGLKSLSHLPLVTSALQLITGRWDNLSTKDNVNRKFTCSWYEETSHETQM